MTPEASKPAATAAETDPAWQIMAAIFSVLAQFNSGYPRAEPGGAAPATESVQPVIGELLRH
jgi:hypothetical protein